MHAASSGSAAAAGGVAQPAPAVRGPQQPHLGAASSSASRARRVIMHCDMDCFYAQVERERFPHWRGAPIGVIQNGTLTVTTNYRIRARGWKKMGPPEGMQGAPGVKFAGSNMVRYRAASKAWYQVFQSTVPGVVVMKKSIDESYLDLTAACMQRIREGHVQRVVRQSDEERARVASQAAERFAKAEAAWRADDALMLSRGVAASDLESTGSLRSAQFFSRSTDPISELRRQTEREEREKAGQLPPKPVNLSDSIPAAASASAAGAGEARPNGTNPLAANAAELEHLTAAQVEDLCNRVHPLDYCRADKRHLGPVMLQPLSAPVNPGQRVSGVEVAPWRELFCGYVFLDGTDASSSKNAANAAAPAATDGAGPATSSLEDEAASPPPSSFAGEDPNNPSHDYLLAVGSQIAFELRSRLFEQLGFTTSASIAPNCMLAKVASSLHKPNQQSVVRASVAARFLAPVKLKAISGFGPKAEEQAEEKGLLTVGDVQRLAPLQLARMFPSDKFAAYLADIAAGVDETPVLVHAAPKSIGQSKRQRTFNTAQRVALLTWLCEKLMERVLEDEREYSRRATVFTFSWITTTDWTSISRRAALPPHRGESRSDGLPLHAEMLDLATRMCKAHLPDSLALRCLAVSVSNFVPLQGGKRIEGYFTAATGSSTAHSAAAAEANTVAPSQSATAAPSQPRHHAGSISSFFSLPPSPSSTSPPAVKASMTPPQGQHTPSPIPVAQSGAAVASTTTASAALRDDSEMPALEEAPLAAPLHLLDDMAGVSRLRREEQLRDAQALDAADALAAGVLPLPLPPMDVPPPSQEERDEIEASFGGSQPVHPAVDAPTLASTDGTASAMEAEQSPAVEVCNECGQSVPAASWLEHSDRHFAAQVQAEVREQDRRQREREQQQQAAAAAANAQRSGAKRKAKSSAAAPAGMSLTRFLVAQPASAPPACAAAPSTESSSSPPPASSSRGGATASLPGASKRAQATQPGAAAVNANPTLKSFFGQAAQPQQPPAS